MLEPSRRRALARAGELFFTIVNWTAGIGCLVLVLIVLFVVACGVAVDHRVGEIEGAVHAHINPGMTRAEAVDFMRTLGPDADPKAGISWVSATYSVLGMPEAVVVHLNDGDRVE